MDTPLDWIHENCLFASKKKTKGILIAFEGIDGSGKTTQADMLVEWLEKQNYPVTRTKWNSSDLVSEAIDKGKDARELSPMLFALLHAADMISRYEKIIEPALDRGHVVVCDRYVYTSFVRDGLRGVDTEILEKAYEDVRHPDIVFHCVSPIEVAFARLMKEKGLTYYGSGMDMDISENREESCMKYEQMMDKEYKKVLPGVGGYFKLDTNRAEKEIFKDIKNEIGERFDIKKDD